MNKKILFRADSSSQIGLGHIMRDKDDVSVYLDELDKVGNNA